jgi:hypothetical protein
VGGGKQRAGNLHKKKRALKTTKKHLRHGWYCGKGKTTARFEPYNVRDCWQKKTEREMGKWIANDNAHADEKGFPGPLS